MVEKNFGYLGTKFQQGLLKTIIEDKKFAITIIDVIKSAYFDGPYFKYLMENIKELYNEYKLIPNYDTLNQKIMAENLGTAGKVHLDTLSEIQKLSIEDNRYIKDTSLKFCRQQVLKKALKESDEIIQNGLFEEYDKIENIITNALQVGVMTDDVIEIGENIRESLQKDARTPFPTGIDGIDRCLKGGLGRGELGIILAPTGIGKTSLLTKFTNAAYNVGGNVLQIVFEDNPDEIRKKHYAIWTGIPPDDQKSVEDEVVEKVEELTRDRKNKLFLYKLSPFGTSVSDIRSKVRKLESEGHKLDVIIIDYVDLISTEKTIEGEEWKGEGTIMRLLEAMTDEFNVAMWTATQGNRESISSDVVTTNQMGGSIKKAQVGHVVISVAKTLEQKEHNLANVTLLKSRIGKDGIIFQNCRFNNELLVFDTESQNTLLGHEEEKVEARKQRAAEVYKASMESKNKTRQIIEVELENLLEKKKTILDELKILEQKTAIIEETPPDDPIFSVEEELVVGGTAKDENNIEDIKTDIQEVVVEKKQKLDDNTENISEEEKKRRRIAEVYKSNKKK